MLKLLSTLLLIVVGFLYTEMAIGLTLTTTAFKPGQAIATAYTCEGDNTIPDLTWSNVPEHTKSFALIMSDPDAPNGPWIHWVVFNIPADITRWQTGVTSLPTEAISGNNSWGTNVYRGPCPPAGREHRYIFTLYALDDFLNLPAGATANLVQKAAENHTLGKAQLMGVYKR